MIQAEIFANFSTKFLFFIYETFPCPDFVVELRMKNNSNYLSLAFASSLTFNFLHKFRIFSLSLV